MGADPPEYNNMLLSHLKRNRITPSNYECDTVNDIKKKKQLRAEHSNTWLSRSRHWQHSELGQAGSFQYILHIENVYMCTCYSMSAQLS